MKSPSAAGAKEETKPQDGEWTTQEVEHIIKKANELSAGSARFATAAQVGVALGQTLGNQALPKLPVKTLGRLLAQPGALNSQDFEEAVVVAMTKVHDMDGKDCIRVLGALMHLNGESRPDAAALQALGGRLSAGLADISNNDMAGLAENLAEVSVPVAPVFARLSAAFSLRVSGASAPQLTKVASAFARARLADRRLFPRMAQASLKQLHVFSPQDLSAFLSAFAAVGLCHEPLLAASANVFVSMGPRLSALDLALVAFSYGQFFLIFPNVTAMLQARLPRCARELPLDRLAELTVSCARLGLKAPELLAVLARNLQLGNLSDELFGQVSKSVALLGLASSPRVKSQMAAECQLRLQGLQGQLQGAWWLLDLLESLGLAAEDSRLQRGGTVSEFWRGSLEALFPALQSLLPVLSPLETATAYRALRQLPPSLVRPRLESPCWQVHEQLALRCLGLATAEAFDFQLQTSTLYSQLCLYPELWSQEKRASESLTNPSWAPFCSSFETLSASWRQMPRPADVQPETLHQASALELLWGPLSPKSEEEGKAEHRNRPVALELQEHILALRPGSQVQGPIWEGPFEIHATLGDTAFCLMPEDAYFKTSSPGPYAEEDLDAEQGVELCYERAAQVHLLRARGWRVWPFAFHTWRRAGHMKRRDLVESLLGAGAADAARAEELVKFGTQGVWFDTGFWTSQEKRSEQRERALENLVRAQELFEAKDKEFTECQARYNQVAKVLSEKRAKRDHLKEQVDECNRMMAGLVKTTLDHSRKNHAFGKESSQLGPKWVL
ncbi:acbC [Symbiodinium sp. KB8]|nr:acbC [Symbiodinium sp. KB8]